MTTDPGRATPAPPASPGSGTPRGGPWVPLVLLLLFHAGLFAPHLLNGEILLPVSPRSAPPWTDLARPPAEVQDFSGTDKIIFNYPNIVRWCASIRSHPEDLLWNPWNWCGIPFLATQNTHVLYPLNVVFLIFGPVHGLLATAILHGFIASALAYAALRRWSLGAAAATIGGAMFGGSGWFLAHQDTLQFCQSGAWVPLMVVGADLALSERRLRGVAYLALAIALSFFGGMPQITIIGLFGTALLLAGRILGVAKRAGARKAGRGALLAILGVVLGALWSLPQTLPTWQFSRESGRSSTPVATLKNNSVHPIELAELVLPQALGNPPEMYRLSTPDQAVLPPGTTEHRFAPMRAFGLSANGATFIERCGYSSLAAILLGSLALVFAPRWRVLAAALPVAVGILALLGTPVLDLVVHVPGLLIGNHRRLVFLLVMGIPALAALGAEALLGKRPPRCFVIGGGVLVAALAVFLGTLFVAREPVANLLAQGGASIEDGRHGVDWLLATTWPQVVFAALSTLALVLAARAQPMKAAAIVLFLALLPDLGHLNLRSNPGQKDEPVFPKTGALAWLEARRGRLEGAEASSGEGLARLIRYKSAATDVPMAAALPAPLPPNLNLLFELPDVQGYEALVDRHLEDVFEILSPGMTLGHHVVKELHEPKSLASPILDLLGVRWVLSSGLLALDRVYVGEPELVAIHERKTALARFFVPRAVVGLGSDAEVLSRMRSPEFKPADEVYVLDSDLRAAGLSAAQDPADDARIELVSYRATEVRLKVRCKAAIPIVLVDAFHPEWKARIENGTELPILRANHAFRLIVAPAGEYQVVFRFAPKSLWLGSTLAVISSLALLAEVIRRRRRGTRSVASS